MIHIRLVRATRRALPPMLAWLMLAHPPSVGAQTPVEPLPRPVPSDTYRDPQVEGLLEVARAARGRISEGLESYEGRMWERLYIGVSGPSFRRERGLIEGVRVARIRWANDGTRVVRWEGATLESSTLGISSGRDAETAEGVARLLSGVRPDTVVEPALPPPLAFDPASDRIAFGNDWALSPLADTAVYHYRYASGDTLRVRLPGTDRQVVLVEIQVQPRRTEFRLVSASLWFDLTDGSLVRAGYRPARPFDMAIDEPESDAPRFLGPLRAEIRHVTMDHGLHDLRWWIPRRYSFEGEATVGSLASFPVQIDWTVDNVRVNEVSTLIPETIPEGWTFRQAEVERDREPLQVTVLVPPAAELALSTELPEGAEGAASNLVREEELEDLRRTLMGLAPPASLSGLELDWGLRSGLTRYNRIEGLSIGVAAALPLPSFLSLRAEARIGFADRAPRGEVSVHRETPRSTQWIGIYRRLDPSSEWATAHGLAASLGTLLWGSEWTPYHRSWGAEAVATRRRGAIRGQIRLFAERHDTAERRTHAHLARLWNGRELPENPPAMEGSWHGAAAGLRWDVGDDPLGPRAFGRFEIEGGFGRTDYGRAWTSLGIAASALGLSAVLEGGVGGASGRLPAQRRFLPGGPASFRGARAGEVSGEAFWFARGEIGRARPALKLVTFVDWLAVGPRDALWDVNPEVAVGAGASLVDGLVRVDLARNLRGHEDWRLFVYLDGLF